MAMGVFIWVVSGGVALAQAGLEGNGKLSREEIEAKAMEHGESAYQNTLETGFTQQEAAHDAGFAAGRRAARLGASPYDAARIAESEVKKRGGTLKDAADAASYAAAEAGGDGYSIGYAIRAVVWDTIASLEYQLRDLIIRYRIAGGEKKERLKKEIEEKSAELDGWIDYVITKAAKDARDAGATPEEEGRAIGAALISMPLIFFDTMTGKSLGDRIRGYLGGSGSGLGAQDQGVLTGKAYQTADPGGHWAGSESDKSVRAAGGSENDIRTARQRLSGRSPERRANAGVGADSQSSAGTATEDADRLAAIGRIMGGLSETNTTSVQTPYSGNDNDLLAKAREGSKKYEVIPREARRERNPQTGESIGEQGRDTSASGSSSSSVAKETQVATSETSDWVGEYNGNGGCGLNKSSISGSGSQKTFTGGGQSFPLSVSGDKATANNVVLFGKGGHLMNLRLSEKVVYVDASNPEGGACSEILTRIVF